MADFAALRETEALVSLADDIAARIAAELRSMEQACQLAREGLSRIAATAVKSVEHLHRLGQEERQGRQLQVEVVDEFAAGDQLRSRLSGEGLAAAFLSPPALATVAQLPAQPFLPPLVLLPQFGAPRRQDLEAEPLPVSPREAGWDILAADIRTFQDRYEEALARLDAAEQEAEKQVEKPAEKKPGRRRVRKTRTEETP